MSKLTIKKLEQVLSRRLKLRHPTFLFERLGTKISGSVIDRSFQRMDELRRQNKIWNALQSDLGEDQANQSVGTILAYTPGEWDLPLEGKIKTRATRKAE